MINIADVIRYFYARTSTQIHDLKAAAYRATEHEKYAYRSPDGKTFRNDRPSNEEMEAGWTYGKVKYQRAESHMSPKHPRWRHYQDARARARLLMAALLLLKANGLGVPEKEEVSPILAMGVMRSQARTSSAQTSRAYSARRTLRKLADRLKNKPERFRAVEEWKAEQPGKEAVNA